MTAAPENSPKPSPARQERVSPKPYIIVAIIFAVICFGGYGLIRLRDAWRGRLEENFRQPVRDLAGHAKLVCSVAFAPDGRRALSGHDDGTVRLWDLEHGVETMKLTGHTGPVTSVAIAPDGKQALSGGSDGTVRLWDLDSGVEKLKVVGHTDRVWLVAFAPDGKRALSGGWDGMVRLWDLQTGTEMLAVYGGIILSVAFSPDGKRALGGSVDGQVRLWDLSSDAEILELAGPELHSEVEAVAFMPDGKRALAAVVGDVVFRVRLWDLTTGEETLKLARPAYRIRSVAFTPDWKHTLSGGLGGTFQLWDINSGRLVRSFRFPAREGLQDREVQCVSISPDGTRALSCGQWRDAEGKEHAELLLWRLPRNDFEYWLLGTEDEPNEPEEMDDQ